jgi:hypothetical protein
MTTGQNISSAVEIHALSCELTVLATAMELSVTTLLNRPDVDHLRQPLTTLQNSAGRVAVAANVIRDSIAREFGLGGMSTPTPANEG